jgi:hypothetical protein
MTLRLCEWSLLKTLRGTSGVESGADGCGGDVDEGGPVAVGDARVEQFGDLVRGARVVRGDIVGRAVVAFD